MREQFVVVEPARTVKVPGTNLKEMVAPKKLAFRRTEFGVMMSVDGSRDEIWIDWRDVGPLADWLRDET